MTANPTEIRDLLIRRIPTGPHLVTDVKVHDGLVEFTVQCGSLRWTANMAVGDRTAKQVADLAYDAVLEWAQKTYGAVTTEDALRVQKFRRAARGFEAWFKSDPRAKLWLRGHELIEDEAA